MDLEKNMEPLIAPVPVNTILAELNKAGKIRATQRGGNDIYIIDYKTAPSVMQEIGRLREETFRDAGGGTGNSVDIDDADRAEDGYKQLIVFDPDSNEIIGGYRFIVCHDSHPKHLSTEHYFQFSERFREEFLPRTIELGRAFIQPKYQGRSGGKKSLYSLDNLWDGLGSLVLLYPHVNYLFGKVTMYLDYNEEACVKLFAFMNKYFSDKDNLVTPIKSRKLGTKKYDLSNFVLTGDFDEDYKMASREIKALGETIPPMFNLYMNLSPTMRIFGSTLNRDFGDVQETAILVTISDIYKEKYERYVVSGNATEENQ